MLIVSVILLVSVLYMTLSNEYFNPVIGWTLTSLAALSTVSGFIVYQGEK